MWITSSILLYSVLEIANGQASFWINNLSNVLTQQGIPEDIKLDTVIGTLRYSLAPGFGAVTYSTNSPYFNVNAQTGTVTLKKLLEGVAIQPQFMASFFALGNNNFQDKTDVIVNVRPVNHPPMFDLATYTFTIAENTTVGTVIYNEVLVTDTDAGNNGTLRISCDIGSSSMQACSTFSLSDSPVPNSFGRRSIQFVLASPLNYKQFSYYNLALIAIDNGSPQLVGRANVRINIANPDDTRPIFLATPIILTMNEADHIDKILGTVQVQDNRQYVPGNSLQFSIADDPQGWFDLTSPTVSSNGVSNSFNIKIKGQVLLQTINFNTQYYFRIIAKQMYKQQETSVSSDTLVTVKINDINNMKPVFRNTPYKVDYTVQAGMTTIPGLYMLIEDHDLGENAFFVLSVTSNPSPVPNIFSVVPTYGQGAVSAALVINRPEYVLYEDPDKRNYVITVTATENKTAERHETSAPVQLTVLSSINRIPYFPNRILPIALYDNAKVGYVITSTIAAVDPDTGTAGSISYSFSPYNSETDSFYYLYVNPLTCMITLAQPVNSSVIQQIMVNLTATDGLGGQNYVIFPVTVLSSQNSGPKFLNDLYTATVPEMSTNLGLRVFASPLINDRVVSYALIGSTYNNLFSINSVSGVVTMNRPVDSTETPTAGYYQLTVQASYSGWNDQPVSKAPIYIYIEDTNNHAPVFNPTTYAKTISELTPPNTWIANCTATDLDVGPNKKIHYIIQSGGRDNFVIDYTTGVVTVSSVPVLSIDRNGYFYNVTIIAVDEGVPPLTGTATLLVTVTDSIFRPPAVMATLR